MTPNREEIAVAIGLVRRGDCFLVGRREAGGPLAGLDEFPGGKCLPGESPEQCVVRECLEEIGLTVAVIRRRCETTHDYPHGRLRLTFMDCESSSPGEPYPPFRWVKRSELAQLKFPEANDSVIADLCRDAPAAIFSGVAANSGALGPNAAEAAVKP